MQLVRVQVEVPKPQFGRFDGEAQRLAVQRLRCQGSTGLGHIDAGADKAEE
jgi:hypothetical protein